MKNLSPNQTIAIKLSELVSHSCTKPEVTETDRYLHRELLKSHFKASDVFIDYDRKRVILDIQVEEASPYNPKIINLFTPVVHTNLPYTELHHFLHECIEVNNSNADFYSTLVQEFVPEISWCN